MSKWMSDELSTYLGPLADNPDFQPPHFVTVGMLEYLDTLAQSDVASTVDFTDWLYQAYPTLDRRYASLVVRYWRKISANRTS